MRRTFSLGSVILMAFVLLLSACSSDSGDATTTTATGSPSTTAGSSSSESDPVLIIGMGQDIPHMDIRLPGGNAASHSALRNITQPLVFFDAEGQVLEGILAESWEQVDPMTWRFKLREGITFHNGDPFNADAVVYSIGQSIDPNFDVWYSYGTGGVLGPAEKVDEYTVDISTEVEAPLLPNLLTVVDMVSPGVSLDEQNTHPIGTGPYEFVEYDLNNKFVVSRYADYWGEPESYSGIEFRIIPETSTRVQALLAGEVQGINSIGVEDISRIEAEAGTKVQGAPQVQHVLIGLRGDRAPLDNPLVREALNYAVDKTLITQTILSGISIPADGFLPPGLPGAQNDKGPWPYDPDKARELLAEAGYAGEEITFAVGTGRYPSDDEVGLAVASMLEAVGINLNYVATDYATYSVETDLREGSSYDMFLASWIADFGDSASMMDAFFSGDDSPIPLFYNNAAYMEASQRAKTAVNDADRIQAIQDMEDIIWDDAAALWLYFPIENYGVAENLEGFKPRVDGFFYWIGTELR